jgi:hypothetical protein
MVSQPLALPRCVAASCQVEFDHGSSVDSPSSASEATRGGDVRSILHDLTLRAALYPRSGDHASDANRGTAALPGATASYQAGRWKTKTQSSELGIYLESGWWDLNSQQPAPKAGPLPG